MSMQEEQLFHGIAASQGIVTGVVFLLDRQKLRFPRFHVTAENIEHEIQRIHEAISTSIEQLESIRARFSDTGADHVTILEAHEMMLRDPGLLDESTQYIQNDCINAEWAVHKVITRLRTIFENISDAYLRERKGDIDFVGERILRNLTGDTADLSDTAHIPENAIVVAHDLSPVDTAMLTQHTVAGFVTEAGGKTSHTSIIARSLGVPAVVGVSGIFQAAGSLDLIIVDGNTGSVLLRPSASQLRRSHERASAYKQEETECLRTRTLPAITQDQCRIDIAGNIEIPKEVSIVLERGGESIGLYRTEFMFLNRTQLPDADEHTQTYMRIFETLQHRSAVIRTLDIGGDKLIGPFHFDPEPNPALGLRGIRYCLKQTSLFETQIEGLLRASIAGNIHILLPMISGLEEVVAAKKIIEKVKQRLTAKGIPYAAHIPIGIMIELPSAALIAHVLAPHVDFFAIGTNDLMQYLMAVDRGNEQVAYLYQPLHPAMLRMLKHILDSATQHGIPVSVCGEIAGDIDYVALLIGLGCTKLSMNAGSIPKIKHFVRNISYEDCSRLAHQMLATSSTEENEKINHQFLQERHLLQH